MIDRSIAIIAILVILGCTFYVGVLVYRYARILIHNDDPLQMIGVGIVLLGLTLSGLLLWREVIKKVKF